MKVWIARCVSLLVWSLVRSALFSSKNTTNSRMFLLTAISRHVTLLLEYVRATTVKRSL